MIAANSNPHKVPKKQWQKWSVAAQGMFNEIYEKAPGQDVERWNRAWRAATDYDLHWRRGRRGNGLAL